jgi:hypothetical protein
MISQEEDVAVAYQQTHTEQFSEIISENRTEATIFGRSGEHTRPACGVRRLAEHGFPARRRKLARGDACAPRSFSPANISEIFYENCSKTGRSSRRKFLDKLAGAIERHLHRADC